MRPHRRHNFLHAKPLLQRRRHPVAQGAIIAVFGVVALVLFAVLAVTPFALAAQRAYAHALAGRDALLAAQTRATAGDFDAALGAADTASDEFSAGKRDALALLPLEKLPYVGPNVQAARRAIDSGADTSVAVRDLLATVIDVRAATADIAGITDVLHASIPDLTQAFSKLTAAQKHRMLAAFGDNAPRMREAVTRIDAALASLDEVPKEGVSSQFAAPLADLRAKLTAAREPLAAIVPLAETLPKLLGYPDERHYLFFFQNDTELRPTGGFLGVYGIATVRDADLAELHTDDVYALDGPSETVSRPAAPAPITKYIGVKQWYLRDANWSPDFTSASRTMTEFFNEEYRVAKGAEPPAIDGIIAVDTFFARDVLALVGPVTIDGKTYSPENLVDLLEFQVEQDFARQGIDRENRKDVVGALGRTVIDRLEQMPVTGLLAAVGMVQKNLAEGHILVSSADPQLQQIVLANDWGGRPRSVPGDYLQWVDANLAALKTDAVMKRTMSYVITRDAGGGFQARVTMTYANTGHFDWKTTRYRTYARVFVPQGSVFTSVDGAMENDKLKDPGRHPGKADVGTEGGHAWFGAFISVEPGETRSLSFTYKLAPQVAAQLAGSGYALTVEKQPGTDATGLTLDLDLGKNIRSAVPGEDRRYWGNSVYTLVSDLRTDREFTVGF